MPKRYYSPEELCYEVYCAVWIAGKPLSRLEICRSIGRKKSPHILGMINVLTAEGWLIEGRGQDRFGRHQFIYSLGQNASSPDCLKTAMRLDSITKNT